MTILKTFKFYGYYITTLRYHNTGRKVPIHICKWEYNFTVSERINNKSKTILTLDVPANKLSGAKRGLRGAMVARKLLKKKGNTYVKIKQKITIYKFILKNTRYFYEWQMVENIRNKLQKEGFSHDETWAWQEGIEHGQVANQRFKAHGYEWETKSGVMGAKGLRMGSESPRHVKIRIVKKIRNVEKNEDIEKIKNIAKKYSNKTRRFEGDIKWWHEDIGYCSIASYHLSKYLNNLGYDSKVIYGNYHWSKGKRYRSADNHYWVSIIIKDREYWIDPTYYQFINSRSILFGSPKELVSRGYKKVYVGIPEKMDKHRPGLFNYVKGGKNNIKYRV